MGYRLKQRALNLTLAIGARLEVAKLAQVRHVRVIDITALWEISTSSCRE